MLSKEEIDEVRSLDINYFYSQQKNKVISDITGIEQFTELRYLYITNGNINTGEAEEGSFSDLTPLKNLKNLYELDLYGTLAKDLTAISGLTDLERLVIESAKGIDISEVENLTKLKYLGLITCDLESEDLVHIEKLTNLIRLRLGGPNYEGNNITDVSSLSKLTNLVALDINNNKVTDITPLKSLKNLRTLEMRCNPITDISALGELTGLTELVLGRDGYAGYEEGVPIEGNIDVLKKLTNLYKLEMSNCGITDISALSNLNSLGELDLSNNSIMDFSPIESKDFSTLQLNGQRYNYTVELGETFTLPQVCIDAMENTDAFVYVPDTYLTGFNCKVQEDGKSIICDEYYDYVTAYVRREYSDDDYSATIRFNVTDTKAPVLKVSYSTKELTKDDVTVTIEANENVQDISGFSRIGQRTYEKEYEENTTESIDVYDIAGNKSVANIKITNIDKKAPTLEVEYSTKEATKDNVTVTIKADEDIQSIEGYTKVDSKTYTKEYSENVTENIDVYDIVGNKSVANIKIANIDKEGPALEVKYSTKEATKDNVTVTIETDEDIQSIKGFTKVDSKTYTKEYSENVTENIDVYDMVGNKSVANIEITNIDKIAPTLEVEYSTKELSNDNVTVTIKADEDIQSIEGFTKVDSKTYTKEYSENVTENIDVYDMAGNKSTANINITNIDKIAPVVEVIYSTVEDTYESVEVTIKVNEDVEEIEGFTKVDSRTYTKKYDENKKETIDVVDLVGNKTAVEVNVANIKDKSTIEEPKPEETKPEEPKKEEPKKEEPKTEAPKKEEPKTEETKAETPKTGDNSMNTIFAVLLMISAGVVVVLKNKKADTK